MKKGSHNEGVVYHAGFPNAAEDQRAGGLSLDALVVRHRVSTFFWKLEESIDEFGWQASSIVVVDRSLAPHEGDTIVAVLDESFVVRRFHLKNGVPILLKPDRTEDVSDEQILWGVITYVVHGVRR